jgi:hypothetical protein
MVLHLAVLENSLYACNIRVTDAVGTRYYHVPQTDPFVTTPHFLDVEIDGNECDIAIAPIKTDTNNLWEDTPPKNFFDKVASKCGKKLVSFINQIILRVTCEYHLTDLKDGDCIDIVGKQYIYDLWDKYGLFELLPMAYAFYEIEYNGKRAPVKQSFGTNRHDVIRTARPLALFASSGYGLLLFLHPIQMMRIRHLSSKRKVFRTIKKFNKMTSEERRQYEERMAKAMES